MRPNQALRQIRDATRLSQSEFAALVGYSTAYIQAVELGQRKPNQQLVEQIADKTGAWPGCLLENWAVAVDIRGEPYTEGSYHWFTNCKMGPCDEGDVKALYQSTSSVLEAAAAIGKSSLAMNILSDVLRQFARRALGDSKIADSLRRRYATMGQISVGQLRSNKDFAMAINFRDDPSRSNDEIVVLQKPGVESTAQLLDKLFPKMASSPDWSNVRRKYARR